MNSFLVVLFAFFAFTGCSCESDKVYGPPPDTEGRASVDMSSDAFEGALLASLLKDNKVPGGIQGIEAFINSVDNPINSVDLDHDGKIDYVKVQESRENSTIVLEFIACMSNDPNKPDNQIPVFTLRLRNEPTGYVMDGGYPSYVHGGTYFSHTVPHSHGLSFGEAYLLAHLLTPARPMWVSPGFSSYVARPYMGSASTIRVRDTYRTQNRVSAIPRSYSAPKSWSAGPQATKQTSTFAQRQAAIQNRSSSGSGLSSFRAKQSTGSVNTNGFRSSKSSSSSSSSSRSSRGKR